MPHQGNLAPIEERLRTHLAYRAETIDVPPRSPSAAPATRPSGRRAFATSVAAAMALAAVVGVSIASNRPPTESDLLDLDLPDSAALLVPGGSAGTAISLDWQESPGVEATELLSMSDGTILALGVGDAISQRGLRVWKLQPDRTWSGPRQAAGLAYQPTAVQAESDVVGLAHGSPWAFQFPELTGGTLLLSVDGQNWSEHSLPMVTDPPHATADLVVAGHGKALLRTMEPSPAAANVWKEIGTEYAGSSFSFELRSVGPDDRNQTLVIDDLDMAIETFTGVGSDQAPPDEARFWASDDYETWREVTVPNVGPDLLEWTGFSHDGGFVVIATTADGVRSFFTSPDLMTWTSVGGWAGLAAVEPLDDGGYLASRSDPIGLYVSDDLVRWQPLKLLDEGLSNEQSEVAIDAGPIGVALAVTTPRDAPFNAAAAVRTDDSPDRVVIFRRSERAFTVLSPDFSSARRIEYSDAAPSPYIEYRPDDDSLQFNDPATGEMLAELAAFDVLAALRTIESSQGYESSLLFGSADEGWVTVDLADEIGTQGPVTDVLVTQDGVIVAFGASLAGPPEVWIGTATIDR